MENVYIYLIFVSQRVTVLLVFVDDQLKAWFSTAMSYTSVLYLLHLILKGYF